MTMKLFQPGDYPWSTCQTCSRELKNAWDTTQLIDDPHFTASSQTATEQSEKCADKLLRENPVCPICRKLITAKQRVHDV